MASIVVSLPEGLREELKEPWGPVFTDVEALFADVTGVVVAVGDVVTFHLEEAGRPPDVGIVDERTERSPVEDRIQSALGAADVRVENPAATLTEELLVAMREGLAAGEPIRILVEGEEDLATVPAILMVPVGGSVIYGQPGEGMVHVAVSAETKARAEALLMQFEGDPARAVALAGGDDRGA